MKFLKVEVFVKKITATVYISAVFSLSVPQINFEGAPQRPVLCLVKKQQKLSVKLWWT
jgi:hypothetical protein